MMQIPAGMKRDQVSRFKKGAELVERNLVHEEENSGVFRVDSQREPVFYTVAQISGTKVAEYWTCDCQDYMIHHHPCKHIYACLIFKRIVVTADTV